MTVLETTRLRIRPWSHAESDLDRIFDTYRHWEVARWLGATPRALESLDEAPGVVDRWASRSEGVLGIWAIEVRESGLVAGTILLVRLPAPADGVAAGEVEIAWHLHPDSWGHGYATEAARGVIERGLAGGVPQIHALVRPDNEPSLAVCRRLGMTALGRTDRWYGTEMESFILHRRE